MNSVVETSQLTLEMLRLSYTFVQRRQNYTSWRFWCIRSLARNDLHCQWKKTAQVLRCSQFMGQANLQTSLTYMLRRCINLALNTASYSLKQITEVVVW